MKKEYPLVQSIIKLADTLIFEKEKVVVAILDIKHRQKAYD